ncbi:MAG TPA: expansin EXLX1 family cellulose-binding protein [Kofleriaceae bacterium]|nr:expansin EXLX1 family cellulose-binding protein [Kofleriaceae bacterium]
MRRSIWLPVALLGLAGCDGCRPHGAPGDAAAARCLGDPISAMGMATFYDADGTGSCSFEASPADLMVAAISGADYDHAAWCGACLAVSGPRGAVIVRVVDLCPGCKHGDLDLSRQAFAQIAPVSAGRVPIAWHEVACPVTGPIAYRLKPGSNAHWAAFQLSNHRYAIEGLAARGAGSPNGATQAYRPISRGDDNYFIATGELGPGPYAFRVTDVHGQVLEDGAIGLAAGAQPGAAQFTECP